MAKQSPGKSKSTVQGTSSRNLWVGILILVVVVVAAYLIWQSQTRNQFQFQSGEQSLVVLLRSDKDGTYVLKYTGSQLAQIEGMQVMMAGEILHVDIEQVSLSLQGQQVVLENNRIPEGQQFSLAPQQTFDVTITFSGQTLGYNYVYGFQIDYRQDGRADTASVVDEDFNYAVIVE